MATDTTRAPEAQENLAAALAWAEAGFPVFPAGPDKRPLVKDWQARATTDPAQIRHWWRKHPDAMPALPMGARSGLAVLDLDRRDDRDGVAAIEARGLDPAALSPVIVETPSGGLHLLFRWLEGMGNSNAGLPAGVDVRGAGGYVIAAGGSGPAGPYNAPADALDALRLIGPAMLPEWPEALRPTVRQADGPSGVPGDVPFEVLREALAAIPNDGSLPGNESRDWWVHIGAALHFETGGSAEGLGLWHEWSRQWPGYDPEATDAAWRSFKRRDGALLTGATVLSEAARHGWRDPRDLARWSAMFDDAMRGLPTETPAESRLTFMSPADCVTAPARRSVIKGLVAEGDVAAIVGAPGVGKSLIAPRIGYAVAQGESVFGLRVRQGGVLYVAAEDEHGMRGRIAALREEHGDAPDFALVGGVTSLFADGDHAALREAVKARRPSLIIIDTLAMAFPGLRENEAESMGLVVAAARALTKWGAAVILIHHDTKDGAQGLPRGHSLLNGALDMSLHLTRDGDLVRAKPSKNRNGSTDLSLAFRISTRVMGEDEDGDEIRTAFASDLAAGESGWDARHKRMTPSGKAALEVWADLAGESGAVEESVWRDACVDGRTVSQSELPESRHKAFRRAVGELTRNHHLIFQGGRFMGADSPVAIANRGFSDDDC